ncbi:MAG: helicase-related protein, partial [Pseudomonadota bacterium]
ADKEKREVLRSLISAEGDALTNGIVFCNRKRDVDIVAKSLKKHGFNADPIHGDLDQSLRMKILTSFRDQDLKILVASDVAARGLDIPSVSHVFNFDVPIHSEDYVHRIGRTGRAGREGKAITICQPSDMKYFEKIEELVKKDIPRIDLPQEVRSQSAEPQTASEPEQAERAPETRSKRPQRTEREEARSEPKERGSRRRGGRGRGYDGGGGPRVVGMGEHVPAFLLRPLRPNEDAPMVAQEETTPAPTEPIEAPQVQDATDTQPTAETESAPKPKRRSRAKAKVETEATDGAEDAEASAPDATDDTQASEEPKKKKPRARKSAKAPEADTQEAAPQATSEPSEGEAPKRKPRARKSANKDAPEAAPETTSAEAPVETPAAEAPPADKPAKKPRKRASAKAVVETLQSNKPDAA